MNFLSHKLYWNLSFLTGAVSLLLGAIVLMGWYTHNVNLIQVNPAFVPMQYNTALGFFLAGLALIASLLSQTRLAMSLGSAVLLIGALTLIEYIFSINLHIDQLFMQHYIDLYTSHPGRMAPNTALCFALSGTTLLFSGLKSVRFESIWLGTLSAIVAALGSVAFLGYLSDIETAYGWGNLTRMAIHTSAGFMVLGLGLVALSWRQRLTKKEPLGNWITISVGIAGFTTTIAVWQALHALEAKFIARLGEEAQQYSDESVLILGILLTIALVLVIWFAQKAQERLDVSIEAQKVLSNHQALLERLVGERTATLIAANEEIKSFAYIVSHDLRSPLVNMKGFTAELEYELQDLSASITKVQSLLDEHEGKALARLIEESIPESLRFITNSVSKMDTMLNAILKLSRLGRKELVIEEINLDTLTHSIVDSLAFQIEQTQTKVTVEPMPTIYNDRMVLEQILGNLIGNAVKYLDPERSGIIHISSSLSSNGITIVVKDNGMGITEDESEKVFQIFRRGKHEHIAGEGMGLSYVQTLVRSQNGNIKFESNSDFGTTFTVYLPLNFNETETKQEEV